MPNAEMQREFRIAGIVCDLQMKNKEKNQKCGEKGISWKVKWFLVPGR